MGTFSETTQIGSDEHRPFLATLSVAVFFVGASEFMLSAMLGPLGAAFGTSPADASWLIASYAFSYALAAPILGCLSDRVDRVRLLRFALLAFAADGIGVAFAPNIEVAMMLRVFGGLASAVIIPTTFALVSEIVSRDRQAGAMGFVMLGMTSGIALGPALAGLATAWTGWRTPFVVTATGCLLAFAVGWRNAPCGRTRGPKLVQGDFGWMRNWSVLRPLISKGAWNGTGVAAFLLSGEILQQRYGLGVAEVGVTVTAFGVGLGIGNVSAGRLRRIFGQEELSLVVLTGILFVTITAFVLIPLPLAVSIGCLIAWGAALGAGAPSSTTILAERAGDNKGVVLAFAETLNNAAIFTLLPAASILLARNDNFGSMAVLATGLSIGLCLAILDVRLRPRRQ